MAIFHICITKKGKKIGIISWTEKKKKKLCQDDTQLLLWRNTHSKINVKSRASKVQVINILTLFQQTGEEMWLRAGKQATFFHFTQ